VVQMMMFSSFLIVFWRVMVLFRLPHEPLAPLRVTRLCRAKHCNCNCNCNSILEGHKTHTTSISTCMEASCTSSCQLSPPRKMPYTLRCNSVIMHMCKGKVDAATSDRCTITTVAASVFCVPRDECGAGCSRCASLYKECLLFGQDLKHLNY
jgi:hypothetical protein